MRNHIFPYEILSKDLALSIRPIQVEHEANGLLSQDAVPDEFIDLEGQGVRLLDMEDQDWTRVVLSLDAEVVPGSTPNLDDLSSELRVAGVAYCGKTNLRLSVPMRDSTGDRRRWHAVLKLDRRQVYGRVELKAILNGVALERPTRFFAESRPWSLQFDASEGFAIHGALPVKWVNFMTDSKHAELREYANEAYFLEINDTEPIVYLNQGLDGLRTVFKEHPRPTGTRLALHEALRTSIAESVWLALFETAAYNLTRLDDKDDVDWPTISWQENVLKRLLPLVYPDRDSESTLAALDDDLRASTMSVVTSKALAVISRDVIHQGKALRKAISQVAVEGK